ncbi:trypsin-like serine protease [Photobacterium damselae]
MKKQLGLLTLSIASLFSISSYAVEDGTSLSWKEHPYLVESECSGTVLAGKYVLLAGHCGSYVSNPFPRLVNIADGSSIMPTHRNSELFDSDINYADIAIWHLPNTVPMNSIAFIADLNDANTLPKLGDTIRFLGFGQKNHIPKLTQAENTVIRLSTTPRFDYSGMAHSVLGDSGAPIFNANNKIIGINTVGDDGVVDPEGKPISGGVRLAPVKDWLLKGINAWHSPTELKFTGSKTVEIQSLHVEKTNLSASWNNGTLSSGDVNVTGGSCVTDGDIPSFGICTLELSSTGDEGHIMLDDGNTITINRAPKPDPKPQPSNGGGSGGSTSILTLIGLLGIAFKRKLLELCKS